MMMRKPIISQVPAQRKLGSRFISQDLRINAPYRNIEIPTRIRNLALVIASNMIASVLAMITGRIPIKRSSMPERNVSTFHLC